MVSIGALTVVLVCVVGVSSCRCQDRSLVTADGRSRTYQFYPEGDAVGRPLVIALHGGGGNADGLRATAGLDALADEEGFAVVYPDGTGPRRFGKLFATWNSDEQCCGDAKDEGVDDVGFITALIDELVAVEGIDAARVYVTGISNGGDMSQRLGCEASERVAAIAPIGAPLLITTCAPSSPVPTMIVHGTADPCASYEPSASCGGCFTAALEELSGKDLSGNDSFDDCPGAVSMATSWRGFNGCGDVGAVTLQNGAATCETFADGCDGAEVVLCTIEGGGHTIPGTERGCDASQRACQVFTDATGPISNDMSLRDVWAFFKTHRR